MLRLGSEGGTTILEHLDTENLDRCGTSLLEGRGDKISAGHGGGGTRNSWQCALPDARPLTNAKPMKPLLFLLATLVFTSSTSDCTVNDSSDGSEGTCTNNLYCHTASTFQSLVASYLTNKSILPLLRGTVDNVVSKSDIDALVASLPANAFVEAGGYSDNYQGKIHVATQHSASKN